MFKIKNTLRLIAFVLSMTPIAAFAIPTLVIDTNGQLTGARDVLVNAELFNVDFREGSCITLYNDCNDSSDFLFNTLDKAIAASTALLDQVLINGVDGNFDSSPELTFGCGLTVQCIIATFYDSSSSSAYVNTASNLTGTDPSPQTWASVISISTDSTGNDRTTVAVWSRTASVPEPSILALSVIGLFAIGVSRRTRKLSA